MPSFWQRLRDPQHVAFATPDVGRVFLVCRECRRMKPHYHVYAPNAKAGKPRCRCGGIYFVPAHLPEWRAAWLVLVVGWLWRKTIRGERTWDPRLPIREATDRYA